MRQDSANCSCRRHRRQEIDSAASDGGSYNKCRYRRITGGFIFIAAAVALLAFDLTGCAWLPGHRFSALTSEWQTRSGQLLYRNARRTLVGDIVARTSKAGDFELTFSKGPGVPLLSIQQDATFAHVRGALSKIGWAGPVAHSPPQLRGWLMLRGKLLAAPDQSSVQFKTGGETFIVHF